MARFGDKGAYKVGNVKICTNAENTREGHFKKMSDKHKELIWLGYRKKFPLKEQINCLCGCGQLASPGKKFIHGHAGGLRFRQINKDRIGKPRVW